MTSDIETETETETDPEIAFAAMARKLAGVTAAIDGFAARQQEIHARDYTEDLAQIHRQQAKVQEALQTLAARPGIAFGPQRFAEELAGAGTTVREADHRAWGMAQQRLDAAVGTIGRVVTAAREERVQRYWIGGAAGVALVIGLLLGIALPGWIDRLVPESWQWPEQRAASLLDRSEWDAGQRLLQVADPDQWRRVQDAVRLASDNADTLATCRAEAARVGAGVRCKIVVPAPMAK